MTDIPPPPPPPPPSDPPPPEPPPSTPTGTVRIGDWFNEGLDRIKPAWTEYLIAGLVLIIVLAVSIALCFVPYIIVGGPLIAGFYIFNAKKMLGMPAEIGDVFKGFSKFTDTLLLFLVYALPPFLVSLLFYLSGILSAAGWGKLGSSIQGVVSCIGCIGMPVFGLIYPIVVGTLFMLAFPLVLFKGMDAISALKASMATVKPNMLNFFLLWLACFATFFVAEIAGLIACGIGIFITIPLALALIMNLHLAAYRDFYGLTEEDLQQYN